MGGPPVERCGIVPWPWIALELRGAESGSLRLFTMGAIPVSFQLQFDAGD